MIKVTAAAMLSVVEAVYEHYAPVLVQGRDPLKLPPPKESVCWTWCQLAGIPLPVTTSNAAISGVGRGEAGRPAAPLFIVASGAPQCTGAHQSAFIPDTSATAAGMTLTIGMTRTIGTIHIIDMTHTIDVIVPIATVAVAHMSAVQGGQSLGIVGSAQSLIHPALEAKSGTNVDSPKAGKNATPLTERMNRQQHATGAPILLKTRPPLRRNHAGMPPLTLTKTAPTDHDLTARRDKGHMTARSITTGTGAKRRRQSTMQINVLQSPRTMATKGQEKNTADVAPHRCPQRSDAQAEKRPRHPRGKN